MLRRPFTLYLLLFFLFFLAFGGLYGGVAMLLDPSGDMLGMADLLTLLPVSSFLLPGLFLLGVMGLVPIFLAYALLAWPGDNGRYRAWIGAIALSVVLGVWLVAQGWLIGFQWPIQYVTAVTGLIIFLLALTSAVRGWATPPHKIAP